MLFNIIGSAGESHTPKLTSKNSEIAKCLHSKINKWMASLTPPGSPRSLQRVGHFTRAEILTGKSK